MPLGGIIGRKDRHRTKLPAQSAVSMHPILSHGRKAGLGEVDYSQFEITSAQ